MYRVDLPYTTRTTGVDILDTDNIFRQRDIDPRLDMLEQDDGTFHRALDTWATSTPATQAVYYWVEDEILPIHTKVNLAGGYNAAATSIVVDDARLFIVNSEIHCTRTLENMLVSAVNYTTNTLTVTRGFGGTPTAALNNNEILVSGIAHLPEMADANAGTGGIPDTEKYNYVSFFSETFKISHLQDVAFMHETGQGKVASVEWEVVRKMFEIKRKINKALIFQHRGMVAHADGTLYMSQGFVHYITDKVLNLGEDNSNLSWPIISDWADTLFEDSASSPEKLVLSGEWLYGAINRMQRDMSTQAQRYFQPELNTDVLEVQTERGNTLKFARDRKGFPANEGLAGWGIVVDMQHVSKKEYTGTPMTWRQGVQHNTAHFRQDEYWGSFSLELRHPSVHGYIRGAGQPLIDREL